MAKINQYQLALVSGQVVKFPLKGLTSNRLLVSSEELRLTFEMALNPVEGGSFNLEIVKNEINLIKDEHTLCLYFDKEKNLAF